MTLPPRKKLLIGVTGATGMLFVRQFAAELADLDLEVHGICSASGRKVLQLEEGMSPHALPAVSHWFDENDFTSGPASGSREYMGMVILPFSLGAIIWPPMPAYYLKPSTLEEAATTYAWRLADQLGVKIAKRQRWGEGDIC